MKRCLRVCVLTVLLVMLLAGVNGAAVFADDTEAAGFVTVDGKQVLYINEANFPDPVLREYLTQKHDFFDHKGYITWFDCVHNVDEIDLRNRSDLKNLQGIEYFEDLQEINVMGTGLTEIDVTNNPNLRILLCSNTAISQIDVSQNPKLESLDFLYCPVKKIDISNNPELIAVNCSFTDVTELNTASNPELGAIVCRGTGIKNLDITENPKLYTLDIMGTDIQSIDFSYHTKLQSLHCDDISFGYLDLQGKHNLKSLTLWNNDLLYLKLPVEFQGDFSVEAQSSSIELDSRKTSFDLSSSAPGIVSSNIRNVSGAELNGTVLENIQASGKVSYEYVCDYRGYDYLISAGQAPAYIMKVEISFGPRAGSSVASIDADMTLTGKEASGSLTDSDLKRLAALAELKGTNGVMVNAFTSAGTAENTVLIIPESIFKYFCGGTSSSRFMIATDHRDYGISSDRLSEIKTKLGVGELKVVMSGTQINISRTYAETVTADADIAVTINGMAAEVQLTEDMFINAGTDARNAGVNCIVFDLKIPEGAADSIQILMHYDWIEYTKKSGAYMTLIFRCDGTDSVLTPGNLESLKKTWAGRYVTLVPDNQGVSILPGEGPKEDSAAAEAEAKKQKTINGVKNTTIKLSSTRGKGYIKLNWKKSAGYKVDYYQVFRSVKRNRGYGTKPIYTTSSGSKTFYKNTKSLKAGTRYYFKVRGVRIIDGKKYYTQYSNKAYRTAIK